MKVRRVPMDDIVTIARVVVLEKEMDEDEEESMFGGEEGLSAGTYAMDGEGRVWKLEDRLTGIFQEFMDVGVSKRGKR